MSKWYKNLYRRNLVDMHINDYDDEFLSKFNAEDYFKYLKTAQIEGPMIYLQSHAGLCNFPTKVSKTHEFFKKHPDELKKLIKLCKDGGMKVVGYYSLVYNNQACLDHPSWEQKDKNNKIFRDQEQRYHLCCPNNKEYREFVETQIKEIAEEYSNLDGIFFDMPFWDILCHCDSCKEEWKKVSNNPLPTNEDFDNDEFKLYLEQRQLWMGDFVKYVKELCAKYLPGVTVEYNYAAVVGCDYKAGSTELINDECEFTGGDLYGDLYNHSFVCKYYYNATKNQPFEYMTCRCNKSLREHTICKNEITLENEVMLTCMHHGASLIIDAINPDGSLDFRVAERLANVFDKQKPYEEYMDKGEMYREVAVYFDSKAQYEYHGRSRNKDVVVNTCKTLIENHIPFGVIGNRALHNLNQYSLIIAPSLNDFPNDELLKLIPYVKDGGTLYLSSTTNSKLLKEFFDGSITKETYSDSPFSVKYRGFPEVQCYTYPVNEKYKEYYGEFNEKYPLPSLTRLPILDFKKGEVCAKICLPYTDPQNSDIFASIHSNPPGKLTDIPAIVEVSYGKGKVIYSSQAIEGDDRYNFKELFMNIVNDYVINKFQIKTSKFVESVIFKDNDEYYINFVDLNFASEIVLREFDITLEDGYKVYETISKKEYEVNNNHVKGTFKKYLSLHIKK